MDKPSLLSIAKKYDKIADKIEMPDDFYEKILLCLKPLPREHLSLLDVGCGKSHFLSFIRQKYPYFQLFGLDISKVLCDISAKRCSDTAIVRADAQRLPFNSQTFDVITCIETLEHLLHPEHALLEIARILKINGVLIVSCPNSWAFLWRLNDLILHRFGKHGFLSWSKKEHRQRSFQPVDNWFSPVELRKLLVHSGFEIVHYGGFMANIPKLNLSLERIPGSYYIAAHIIVKAKIRD